MDSIPKYIACKNGKEAPEYLHPALEPILKETYGVMTYQDDVMRIARELAGYTHGRGRPSAPRHGQENSRRDDRRSGRNS